MNRVHQCILGVLPLAAGLGLVVSAQAKDFDFPKRVKAGKSTILIKHSSFRGKCETKPAEITILEAPKNGTTEIKKGPRKFSNNGKGRMASCNGKTGVASAVVYKPNASFNGRDKLRYEVKFASGKVNKYSFRITVGKVTRSNDGWQKAK